MVKFPGIIKKILSYDDPIYFQLPKEINEQIIINFEESNNIKNINKNFKINIEELSRYYNLDKIKIVKLLFCNIENFQNILYNHDKEIKLEKEDQNLSYIFYAALLIKNNPNIINYSFTIELIRGINNKINECNIYQELLLSKVIFDLIDGYKGLDEYINNKKEIQEIEANNTNKIQKIIINKKNELKLNLNLEYIKSETVDQIYIDIIIGLLKNKSENYKYIFDTLSEMDFISINLTKTMFKEIKKFLDDEKNGIIDKYLISKSEDLFNENKINFSYILLKYILKSPIFIYQIKFFLKVRNNILNLCKSKSNIFSSCKINKIDKQMIDKLNYILEIILNSEYYNKYKIKEINLIEDKSSNSPTKMLDNNSKNTKNDSIRKMYSNSSNDSTNNSQSTLKDSSISNENTIKEEDKDTQNAIINSNEDNNKSNMETSNNLNSSNKNSNSYTQNDYLNNNNKTNNDRKEITENNNNQNSKVSINPKICNSIKIIGEYIKGTSKKKCTAEFITEIQNIFVSSGTNNELTIYNDSYEKIYKVKKEDWIYNVLVYKNKMKKNFEFLASSKKNIYIFSEEQNKSQSQYKSTQIHMKDNYCLYFLYMESSYYFSCCGNDVILHSAVLDNLQMQNQFEIYKNTLMKSAIKINDDLVIFKSNKIVSKGISQLLLFNYRTKKDIPKFFEPDEEYSFVFSPLGQALITHKLKDAKDKIGNRILLFACKKYIKNQKNGILLIYNMHFILKSNGEKSERVEVDSSFYNTDSFEPYCICPLLLVDTNKIFENSDKIKETDYFLVGGFEKKRKQGKIKLYKIIYGKESLLIEYIQDIEIFDNNFKGFKGPISCITQSKKDGNLLITCWDGKVYLIDYPDISFYLKQYEQIQSALDFFPSTK